MPLKRKTIAPRPDLSDAPVDSAAGRLPGLMLDKINGKPVTALPLDKLEPSPSQWNFYAPLPDGKFIELIESIQRSGLLHPIVVWRKADGALVVLSGHNRLRAYKALRQTDPQGKYASIPATVLEGLTDDQAREIVIDSNWVQRNLSPSEKARSIYHKYMLAGRKARSANGTRESTYDVIAAQYGLSGRQIARYIRLGSIDRGLQELVDQGRLSLRLAMQLAGFPPERQAYLAQQHAGDLKKKQAARLRPDMTEAEIDRTLAGAAPPVAVTYTVPAALEAEFRALCESWLQTRQADGFDCPLPEVPDGDPLLNGED